MQTKDLLDCSQDVLRAEKALEVQYEEYYEQLADQQSLSPEEQAALRSDCLLYTSPSPPTPLSTWRRSRRIALPPASTFTRSL